ncbi:NAD(P)/FAD-dependent oxidoreductase [Wenxinia saemankumensis]|nr:FAD-binding oxidoreductase [Wenxinia saemankumensis]
MPLYRNDAPGQYPPSWYVRTTDLPHRPRPRLEGGIRADLCVIGAGYTGLWAALTAARAGLKVVVVEAHRAGFGASGRNGGQVHSGFNKPQSWLETRLGADTARALWELSEDGKASLRNFCASHAPETLFRPGIAHGEYDAAEVEAAKAEADFLNDRYGYDRIEMLDRDGIRSLVKTESYVAGQIDRGAGHLHPMRYCAALARAAETAGADIHELTEATGIVHGDPATVTTPRGRVVADHVIIAGNGYLPGIEPKVAARVMPINSFIGATEPMGERWRDVLAEDIAVADSKFVVNYYRFTEDRRFLFGGRESYSIGYPKEIAPALVARMRALFPQMADVEVESVWGGTLGITVTRLPHLARVAPNVLSGAGFSGHGVSLAGLSGRAMAEAVIGQAGRFDVLSQLPVPRFPGGARLRAPLLTLAMTWFALRDRLGI